jgi:molybdate transport system ATP-binding protein
MSIANIFPATVLAIGETPTPGHVLIDMKLNGGEKLVARITHRSRSQLGRDCRYGHK